MVLAENLYKELKLEDQRSIEDSKNVKEEFQDLMEVLYQLEKLEIGKNLFMGYIYDD